MKRLLGIVFAAMLVLSITAAALADEAVGKPHEYLVGHLDPISASGVTSGNSYISQEILPVSPSWLEVNIDGFQDGTYAGSQRMYVAGFASPPWYIPSGQFPIGNSGLIEAVGWHYGTWDNDTESDSCSTYEMIQLSSSSAYAASDNSDIVGTPVVVSAVKRAEQSLAQYAKSDTDRAPWFHVTLQNTSKPLESYLGHTIGIELEVLFRTKLTSKYLWVGDTMPVLLVSPSKKDAVALFFHGDGSLSTVTLSLDDSDTWVVNSEETSTK